MKKVLLTIIYIFYFLNSYAQDLSGEWQGLEFNPGAPTSEAWPSLLSIQQSSNTVSLYQVAATNKRIFVKYRMSFTIQKDKKILMDHRSVMEEAAGYSWCYGTFILKYDEAQEKLTGTSKYPSSLCNPGTLELYRIRLKSPNEFCKGRPVLLTVTGKNIKWYADGQKKKLLATGNTFQPKISETSVFYVTQTYYGVESPVVPFTIKIRDCAPAVKKEDQIKTSVPITVKAKKEDTIKTLIVEKIQKEEPPKENTSFVGLPEKITEIPINYQKTITVKNREITIYPYDNEKEDGDIVSININGVWVRDKYTLKIKKPSPNENDLIKCLLNEGENNYFISRAWNLGTIPPNTLTIKIDDGVSIQEVMINAQLGMSGGIRIVCSK